MVSLFVSPEKLRILVIGGGPVALRKCVHFAGADITVISEDVMPEMEVLSRSVIRKRVTASDIRNIMRDFNIIVAATNDAVLNSEIKDEALRLNLYVNSAHGGGNVVIPSVLRRDGYTISVSTEGRLPAFPPFLVDELDKLLDEKFDHMFSVLSEARRICAGRGTQAERSEFLRRVARDPEIRRFVRSGDIPAAVRRCEELGVPP
jgi:siroheme synthase-like protein